MTMLTWTGSNLLDWASSPQNSLLLFLKIRGGVNRLTWPHTLSGAYVLTPEYGKLDNDCRGSLRHFYPDDVGMRFFRNTGTFFPGYTSQKTYEGG
jgi:hypothetical protein